MCLFLDHFLQYNLHDHVQMILKLFKQRQTAWWCCVEQRTALQDMRASELCKTCEPQSSACLKPWQVSNGRWPHSTFDLFQELTSSWRYKLCTLKNKMSLFILCSPEVLMADCNQQTTTLGHVSESVDPRWFQGGCSLRHGSGAKLKTNSCWTNFHWLTLGCQNGFLEPDSAQRNSKQIIK